MENCIKCEERKALETKSLWPHFDIPQETSIILLLRTQGNYLSDRTDHHVRGNVKTTFIENNFIHTFELQTYQISMPILTISHDIKPYPCVIEWDGGSIGKLRERADSLDKLVDCLKLIFNLERTKNIISTLREIASP